MEKKDFIKIAKIAITKRMDYETLKYSDWMYGNEDKTEDVWKYVEECDRIGQAEFNKKYQ